MAVLFVVCQSVGILWADAGGRLSPAWHFGAISFALLILLHGRIRRSGVPARWRFSYWALIPLLAFLIGQLSHAARLDSAQRDAMSLTRLPPGAFVNVDAEVVSRTAGRFGDSVRLRSLRSVESGEILFRRAELRLSHPRGAARGTPAATEEERPTRGDRLLWPGANVRLGLRFSRILGTRNPGSVDWERTRERDGLAVRARLIDPDWVMERVAGPDWRTRVLLGSLMGVRLEASRRAWRAERSGALQGAGAGEALARALVLGDRSAISDRAQSAYRATGLGHLLAVSGLHVGFVAGIGAWGTRSVSLWVEAMRNRLGRLRRRRTRPFRGPIWAGLALAAGYAWMTGAAISVARASFLLGLFVVAREGGRSLTPISALAWVAAVLLWMNPASLFDLGARFSFSACLALAVSGLWASRRDENEEELFVGGTGPRGLQARWVSACRLSLMASLAVSFGTLPWVAHVGGALHGLSPLLNLFAIPWTGLAVLPASMVAVFSVGVGPEAWTEVMLWPAAWLEANIIRVAEIVPPLTPLVGLSPTESAVMGILGIALVRRGALGAAMLVWCALAIAGVRPSLNAEFREPAPRAIFFDVGQGDAALIQSGRANWLVDTGPGPEDGSGGTSLLRALETLGVREIDVLVITHADLDHRAGATRILESLTVKCLWLPTSGREEPSLLALAKRARGRGTRVRFVAAGAKPRHADSALAVDVLWPLPGAVGGSRNESSIVLRFETEDTSLLMMADVGHETEQSLIEEGQRLRADLLKVGHHGSRGSTGQQFLEAVSPRWAILSAPCDATRGLPTRAVIDRILSAGTRLAWTGREGALAVSLGSAAARFPVSNSWGPEAGRVQSWAPPRMCLGPN